MSDYCECGKLKEDCTHPSCPEEKQNPYPKVCLVCNHEPCTCVSECERANDEKFYFKFS
jgi:hypothetical protein